MERVWHWQLRSGRTYGRKQLSRLWLSLALAVSQVAIIGFVLPETAFGGAADSRLTITVRVDNYSQASAAVLAAAEHEAGRILAVAGVEAVFSECPIGLSNADQQGPCGKGDLTLRILSAPIRNTFQSSVFGFSIHPVLASVYYGNAALRAKNDGAEFETPTILGCVIAHELGHLLLGPSGHSATGIMQPRWKPTQVRQLMMGTLLFTPEQSKLMQADVRSRREKLEEGLASISTPHK